MASENKAPAEEPASKPTLMSLPFEIRKQIFAFAEPSGDELKVFLCNCHLTELKEQQTKTGQCAIQYRPPPPLSRSLLRVSRQVQAEAKDLVDHRRTLVACSMLCAADAFEVMPEDEMNMTKTVLFSRTLHDFIMCFRTQEFERQYTEHIRDELRACYFETPEIIRTKTKDEGGFITFEYEFEVGQSRKVGSQQADHDFITYLIRGFDRTWRLRDIWRWTISWPQLKGQ